MSKKLIAVASAVALSLSALVATPAMASSFTVKVDEVVTASHTSATNPGAVAPSSAMTSRTLDYRTSASTSRNVVRFDVDTVAGTTINVTSTAGVLVVDDIVNADATARNVGAGSTSYSKTTVAGLTTVTFYAYSTSTTPGTVVIESASQKATYFVKGVAGGAYNLVGLKFPTSILQGVSEANSEDLVTFKITDVFGNELAGAASAVAVKALGASASTTITYSTVRKQYEAAIFSATGSSVAISVELTATDLSANGFAKPIKTAFATVSAGDLATQVAALTAQVAALQATVAKRVTKKRYNTLARKWNKAFPTQKVALKK
jgi:hypothetical protein